MVLGVSRQGKFKNTITIFLQKVHVENFPQNIDQKNRCQFILKKMFYRVFGCFSAMGVQKHHKKRFTEKNRVEKFLQKNRPKQFFLDFFYHVFWRFTVRGVHKHDKKYQKTKSYRSPFLASDPPTHHGGPRLFFWRPLGPGRSKPLPNSKNKNKNKNAIGR
jgi:hypothetical protein